jgi:hypothetical protein
MQRTVKIELVPSRVHRRHTLAGVGQQRSDLLFQMAPATVDDEGAGRSFEVKHSDRCTFGVVQRSSRSKLITMLIAYPLFAD